MEKHDVEFFGTLLNTKPEDVELAIKDGTLSEKVKALNLMRSDEVETLKANLTKQVKETHIDELVEEAKKGNLNKDLHKVIKGATLEMTEKDLAKEYGIDAFEGINDLVQKAISKNKGRTDDTKAQELAQKVKDLQVINENLVKEKDEAVIGAKSEYEGKILTRDKRDIINHLPFDFSDVDQADLEKITGQRRQIVESVFDARYSLAFDGDKVVVKDKEGKVIQNKATLNPVPASDVMRQIPIELGIKIKSPEGGGQGGSSSAGSGTAPFKNVAEFNEYCEDKGILTTSAAGVKIWSERRPK